MADRREPRPVDVDVDPVRDDAHRKIGEVSGHEIACRLTDRDRAVEVAEVGLEKGPSVVVTDVGASKGVESAHVGRRRHPQHGHRQCRHQWLVEVQDVEALLLDDGRDSLRQVEAQGDARHRIVRRDRDRGADAVEARPVESNVGTAGRREDPTLVAELLKLNREVTDVVIDPTCGRKVIGRDQTDLHFETPRGVKARGVRGGILIPPRFFMATQPICDAVRATGRGEPG